MSLVLGHNSLEPERTHLGQERTHLELERIHQEPERIHLVDSKGLELVQELELVRMKEPHQDDTQYLLRQSKDIQHQLYINTLLILSSILLLVFNEFLFLFKVQQVSSRILLFLIDGTKYYL